MREQLANGPKPRSQIEAAVKAADIPERSLIVAADMLGVRTQKGQWYDAVPPGPSPILQNESAAAATLDPHVLA